MTQVEALKAQASNSRQQQPTAKAHKDREAASSNRSNRKTANHVSTASGTPVICSCSAALLQYSWPEKNEDGRAAIGAVRAPRKAAGWYVRLLAADDSDDDGMQRQAEMRRDLQRLRREGFVGAVTKTDSQLCNLRSIFSAFLARVSCICNCG